MGTVDRGLHRMFSTLILLDSMVDVSVAKAWYGINLQSLAWAHGQTSDAATYITRVREERYETPSVRKGHRKVGLN